jgi:hypothetical protein
MSRRRDLAAPSPCPSPGGRAGRGHRVVRRAGRDDPRDAITPATQVEVEHALAPVTIADGDALEIEARLVGAVFEATRVEVDDFPELKLRGTVQGLPPKA